MVDLPPAGAAAPYRRLRLPRDPPGACRGALAWDAGRKSVSIAGDPWTGRSASGPERTGGKRGVVARDPACCSREALVEQRVERRWNSGTSASSGGPTATAPMRLEADGVPGDADARTRQAPVSGPRRRGAAAGGVAERRQILARRATPARRRPTDPAPCCTIAQLPTTAEPAMPPAESIRRPRSARRSTAASDPGCRGSSRRCSPGHPPATTSARFVALASLDASVLARAPACCRRHRDRRALLADVHDLHGRLRSEPSAACGTLIEFLVDPRERAGGAPCARGARDGPRRRRHRSARRTDAASPPARPASAGPPTGRSSRRPQGVLDDALVDVGHGRRGRLSVGEERSRVRRETSRCTAVRTSAWHAGRGPSPGRSTASRRLRLVAFVDEHRLLRMLRQASTDGGGGAAHDTVDLCAEAIGRRNGLDVELRRRGGCVREPVRPSRAGPRIAHRGLHRPARSPA